VHPVENDDVMAGNGTIGLEILEDLPEADAVVIPWGGGGLTTGIASAVKQLRPEKKIHAVEPETAAPLSATLAGGGEPVSVEYAASFVDGAGSRALLPRMWEAARPLVDGAHAVSLADTAAAVKLLAERARVVVEGAGALSVAAALSGLLDGGKLVCVVSGGNIDFATLTRILADETP
jgi:threonine dehydratase